MKQKWNIQIESLDKLAEDLQRIDDLLTDLKDEIELLQIGNFHAEPVQESEETGNIKALIGQKVFLVNKNLEYYEAANIKEATYSERSALLKLRTVSGRCEFRDIEELGKTIFFTEDEAMATLKVDEDGNPINTYLMEFIKRFPEHKGKEREILEEVCCSQIFGLQGCQDYIEYKTPADCEACWNRPYKEAKGGKTDEQRNT